VEPLQPSLWYKDAVIYQLHVKAYADGDGDGIGDFSGLIEKLPYIKDLGATAIWLLPFYPSPLRDDGYDISEYKGVNPSYGTMRDVRAFIKAAHKLDIRIITELVVNHTSDQHPWFQRARRAPKGSFYRNFYVWSDSPEKYAGTRIIFTDTESSNWAWDGVAGEFYWHRFFSHQPDLNFDHPPVFDAIVDVMRFWFNLGVDGMRLDAVPYLYEREGTSSENLPETHVALKRLRAVLDAEFPDRLLLAEANMWPEDVNAYFGDGDECQMAFHFPLMPRMFMSIAEEDRYPLYDIMRQTPQIPANCQWAIFLRNHDELTLEMVTDRERAFMYSIYARETRARINVGIRRRLAPLMENDRRKIELMTSLLLSMPGTPIVYYGDEIGMGDNIYLGDRDGVRTSMQWSADRNGRFSRADTQRLFLPPIMDPVYGYASTNAEAQERSASSLLHWMRRIIGVRQAHRVFGRGTITFLHPNNRHVAAYVREYEGEIVLCVANLSRASQAVSLDLSRYAGRTPVEMIGWSPFPPILDDRYTITLHGHAFFWFVLATAADAPVPMEIASPQPPEFITVVLPQGRASLLTPAARLTLERDVLPNALAVRDLLLPEQLGTALRVEDIVALGAADDAPSLAILGLAANEEAFILPAKLAHATEREWSLPELRAAFAKTRTGPREGLLLDASIDDDLWCGLFTALQSDARFAGTHGTLACEPTWSLEALAIDNATNVRRPQSGDRRLSAVIGETVLISLYRRTVTGINPAIELARTLHEQSFQHTAPLLGTFTYRTDDGGEVGVGLARRYILAQGDCWSVLRTLLMRALAAADDDRGPIDRILGLTGRRLAEMHAAFARSDHPAFVPRPYADADALVLQAELRALAHRAFAQIALDASPEAAAALALRPQIDGFIADAPLAGARALRVHGDFHLARVLVTESDVLIIDPGVGEAVRPAAQRRRLFSPYADVATMIRSLDEVTFAAAFDVSTDPTVDSEHVVPTLRGIVRAAATTFVRSYLARAKELDVIDDRDDVRGLIDVFLVRATFEAIVRQAHPRPERMRDLYAGFTRIFERSEASTPACRRVPVRGCRITVADAHAAATLDCDGAWAWSCGHARLCSPPLCSGRDAIPRARLFWPECGHAAWCVRR
jgi:maltose alpha-D-glucosyltransferase/alpha-amylase